jgi:YVTN family beta-propeller protein
LGLTIDPTGSFFLAACFIANHLVAVETRSWQVAWKVPVGSCHVGLCLAHQGRVALITNADQDHLSVFDLKRRKEVSRIRVRANPAMVQVIPGSDLAYVTDRGADSVSVVDVRACKTIHTIPVGSSPLGVCIG